MRQHARDVESESLGDRILASLDTLTPAERRVGRTVLASYPGSGLRSASAIATASETSAATVLRFVTKLGFDGLPAFHSALRDEIDRRLRSPFELDEPRRDAGGLLGVVLDSQLRILAETLGRLRPETLASVSDLVMTSSRVWLLGGRFSYAVAHYLHAHLQLLRSDVRLLGSSAGPVADELAYCGRRDCLVAFDFRRYQGEASFAARFVKERRGRVVVVTDPYLSPAAQAADHVLVASIEGPGVADSYTGAVALADALVSRILVSDERLTRTRLRHVEEARAALGRAVAEDAAASDGALRSGERG